MFNPLGTLLHFEDVALKGVVILDPQWLTKLLASLINPSTAGSIGSLVKDGKALTHDVGGEGRGGGGGGDLFVLCPPNQLVESGTMVSCGGEG